MKLPKVADSVDEVIVSEVLVQAGDPVTTGQALILVETDKAQVEVPSPVAGTLVEVLVGVDSEIQTGTRVAIVETT